MKKNKLFSRAVAFVSAFVMCLSLMPTTAFAKINVDTAVSNNYYNVISQKEYALAPGATETEIIVNNVEGSDRKVVHVFEVDIKNENVEVLPGYYGIDKLDPENLALDGIDDKAPYWKAMELTKTVSYYENNLGYNVVGAMNTALAYDSNAPYGYMVWNGVVLGTPEVHPGAQTYLAINGDGTCELRSMSTPLTGEEKTAISANFGWLVKDGKLTSTSVERTSSDASRSMIGIKADGTLVFCQVDGRNAPTSTGLSNYEMGEMMLSLGCVNAVNCDGGGSSTFVSKREGEANNTMRSVPSDGSERPTINSVIIVSKAKATGEFDHAVLDTDYDYYAPGTTAVIVPTGVDAAGTPAELPTDGITWGLSDDAMGSVADGVFTSNGTKGDVTVKMFYNGEVVGEKVLHIVDPDTFALKLDETVLPYGKDMTVDFACTYGADDWDVCVDGAYTLTLSDAKAATLDGNKLTATTDEAIKGVNLTATYIPDPSVTDILKVTYGKGSEIVFDFEDGDISNFLGIDEMYDWAEETGATAPIQNNGNYSENTDSETFLATAENGGKVRNGEKALGVTLDYTDADFASWSYNMFFYTGESVVLRDVANGKNATTFGMWVYIPEGAAGLAMQIQGYKNSDGTGGTGAHFNFTTVSGAVKNLNSCTEADIPESRWVYATCDLTQFGDFFATYDPYGTNGREPSFVRFYVKPSVAAKLDFYFDDFTLDYSSAVDDRVLPTITNVSYATEDTSVELTSGAQIAKNTMSFSANISDNDAVDTKSGKILVDGMELTDVKVTNRSIASENVTLLPGTHTVSIEVCDRLGNLAKVTRTFTVAGDEVITLSGHNESGEAPEYASTYYVDINAADMSAVNKLTATLKLHTANTWEQEGAIVAKGFDATFDYNEISRLLTVTLEKNANAIDDSVSALVSIPVRVWSWDGKNHVTDAEITPETQYKTGYCPVVTIECKVIKGAVELVNNDSMAAFGGALSVATKVNDTVYPWHYHDAELATLNKEATCTEGGYADRTYCETCKSVIEWGTIKAANGHSYDFADGVLVCTCGETFTGVWTDGNEYVDGVAVADGWNGKYYYLDGKKVTNAVIEIEGLYYSFDENGESEKQTGLFSVDGVNYYAIAGKLTSGWQQEEESYYYFDTTTFAGVNGKIRSWKVYNTSKNFDYSFTNGKLDSGVWVDCEEGVRYYYGPGFYHSMGWSNVTFQTIDGNEYGFNSDGYRYEGLAVLKQGRYADSELYSFDEKGVLLEKIEQTGIYSVDGTSYYFVDGVMKMPGLVKINDEYYYFSTSNGEMATNVTRYVAGNCIDASAFDMKAGTYTFGADGKLIIDSVEEPENPDIPEKPEEPESGKIENGYYYVNGVRQYTGLTKVGDDYYYFSTTSGKMSVSVTKYVNVNCIDASASDKKAGTYTFGADGKLIIDSTEEPEEPEKPDTPEEPENPDTPEEPGSSKIENGYYYVNGVRQYTGLTKVGDDYYYFSTTSGKISVSVTKFVNVNCIDASASDMKAGTYTFGSDGKLIIDSAEEPEEPEKPDTPEEPESGKIENGYYYVNGVRQYTGLTKVGDDYYYFSTTSGKMSVSVTKFVNANCIDASASDMKAGAYTFGSDGKMIY